MSSQDGGGASGASVRSAGGGGSTREIEVDDGGPRLDLSSVPEELRDDVLQEYQLRLARRKELLEQKEHLQRAKALEARHERHALRRLPSHERKMCACVVVVVVVVLVDTPSGFRS